MPIVSSRLQQTYIIAFVATALLLFAFAPPSFSADAARGDVEICNDDIDNDGNNFTDCDDFACADSPFCVEQNCDDEVDNDNDGFTDCEDFDCDVSPSCVEQICGDEIDNDNDGFTDCEDFDCAGLIVCEEGEICTVGPVHTADQNADNVISLSELLRVIQFFNSTDFGCGVDTEDGFAPDESDKNCCPHDSDYSPQDWDITLSELLRLIQFFNSTGYTHCPLDATEDGFCPGAP